MTTRAGRADAAAIARRRFLTTTAAAAVTTALAAAGCGAGRGGRSAAVPTSPGTTGHGTVGLAIVGILTADIDRSLGFYRGLGLDVPDARVGDSFRLRTADGHVLFWETPTVVNGFDPSWQLPPPGDRRVVLEFGFANVADLETTYRSVTAAGAVSRLAPFDLGGGIRYAVVEDPDGNQVSLRYPAS